VNLFKKSWSLQAKLVALVVAVMLLLSGALVYLGVAQIYAYSGTSAQQLEEKIVAQRQAKLEALVDTVHTLLTEYYQRFQRGELTEDDAQGRAFKRISNMRYDNGQGYFWLHAAADPARPVMLMHPLKPEMNGQDLSGQEDFATIGSLFYKNRVYRKDDPLIQAEVKPTRVFVAMNEVCVKDGAGFVRYYWPKPGEDQTVGYPKLSYVKLFEPWNWVIGTGFYVDEVDREVAAAREAGAAAARHTAQGMIAVGAGLLLAGAGVTFFFMRRALQPLQEMVRETERVAQGEGGWAGRHPRKVGRRVVRPHNRRRQGPDRPGAGDGPPDRRSVAGRPEHRGHDRGIDGGHAGTRLVHRGPEQDGRGAPGAGGKVPGVAGKGRLVTSQPPGRLFKKVYHHCDLPATCFTRQDRQKNDGQPIYSRKNFRHSSLPRKLSAALASISRNIAKGTAKVITSRPRCLRTFLRAERSTRPITARGFAETASR